MPPSSRRIRLSSTTCARGLLDMTGGFADGTGGAYLLSGIGTLDEARAIVAADPLALQNASDLVVHEWHTR